MQEIALSLEELYFHHIAKFEKQIDLTSSVCCSCQKQDPIVPIPVNLKGNTITYRGACCSFLCLMKFLKTADMYYTYSYNVLLLAVPNLLKVPEVFE